MKNKILLALICFSVNVLIASTKDKIQFVERVLEQKSEKIEQAETISEFLNASRDYSDTLKALEKMYID